MPVRKMTTAKPQKFESRTLFIFRFIDKRAVVNSDGITASLRFLFLLEAGGACEGLGGRESVIYLAGGIL